MGIKSKNPKPPWKKGVDMPEFSGKSWKELQDIWPNEIRVANDAWKIISVFMPAFICTQQFMKTLLNGNFIGPRDFMILCWILRVQEAKEDVALDAWPAMKGMNISGSLWYNRKAQLTALGLIENAPSHGVRIYRVTGTGKVIIKYFVTQLEQAHSNLRHWVSLQKEESADKITEYLNRYWPGWNDFENI